MARLLLTQKMVQAYVFINVSIINPLEIFTLRQLLAVKQAHVVLGSTDCIALIECANHEALQEIIPTIQVVRGVAHTGTRYVCA